MILDSTTALPRQLHLALLSNGANDLDDFAASMLPANLLSAGSAVLVRDQEDEDEDEDDEDDDEFDEDDDEFDEDDDEFDEESLDELDEDDEDDEEDEDE